MKNSKGNQVNIPELEWLVVITFWLEAVKQIRSWRRVGEFPEEFTFLPIDFESSIHITMELD